MKKDKEPLSMTHPEIAKEASGPHANKIVIHNEEKCIVNMSGFGFRLHIGVR